MNVHIAAGILCKSSSGDSDLRLMRGVVIELESPEVGLRNLLIRVSPLSILAFIFGMCSLFMPWLIESWTFGWTWPGEWTHVMGVDLPMAINLYSMEGMIMLYSIVIGSFAVVFTSSAVAPMALGIILFLNRWWDEVVLHETYGPDVFAHYSFALGFFFSVLACILGALSALPRIAPCVRLIREVED
jgi:hypothetical protein